MAPKHPQIRIESTGLGYETKVTHIESGADLTPCIRSIKWELDASSMAKVTLEIVGIQVSADLQGHLEALTRQAFCEDVTPLGEIFTQKRNVETEEFDRKQRRIEEQIAAGGRRTSGRIL